MKPSYATFITLGLMAPAILFSGIARTSYERSLNRCEQILQESAIEDRYFCKQPCERESLLELVDEYKLEDRALVYRLAINRCGK